MHHAYLLIGTCAWALAQIPESERVLGTDTLLYTYDRMGIADARALIEESLRAPLTQSHRIFILSTQHITHEAQNALLKLFEEPPLTARFYIIVPRAEVLIETLRSRLFLRATEGGDYGVTEVARAFITASYGERLEQIAAHAKKKDDVWMDALLSDSECIAHATRDIPLMRDVVQMTAYARSSGASKKMILEHIALSLPRKT
jgi:hypothetical protein